MCGPLQNRGNDCMKRKDLKSNKYFLKHAYEYYTKALGENSGDDKLDAVCLSNRAQAHLLLGAAHPQRLSQEGGERGAGAQCLAARHVEQPKRPSSV